MRWVTSALPVLPMLLAAAPAAKPDPGAALWKDAVVLAELVAAEKALDAHLGRIPKRPRVLLSSREFAFERSLADVREAARQTTSDEWFLRSSAASTALGAFAFYEPAENTVHLIPENFKQASDARKDPLFLTREFLRLVLIHELVHAWDNQVNELDRMRKKNRSLSEWKVFGAVSEGHAQYVTKQVMASMNRLADFEKFTEASFGTGGEPDEDPAERFLRTRATLNGRFGYVDGLVFYEGLAKRGKPELLSVPFSKPPASVSVVLHPERYKPDAGELAADGGSGPAPLELPIAMRRFVDAQEPGWAVFPIPMDEQTLLADAGSLLDVKKVASTLEPFVTASAFGAQPDLPDTRAQFNAMVRTGAFRQTMICAAVQMRDADAAKRLLAMWQRLAAVQGETLAKGKPGAVPTLKNGALTPTGKAKGLTNFRTVSILQLPTEKRNDTRVIAGLARGPVAAYCDLFASPRTDEQVGDLLDTLAGELSILD